uniref:tetratricopeptide repeat protein n=1 Tax=Amycolatopsis sp. CA-096443 TaxID=3239919 RepID=UPI003F490F03
MTRGRPDGAPRRGPARLPDPPPRLFGRGDERYRLDEIWRRTGPAPRVAVITGAAGTGKTALASATLHARLRLRGFPDGVLCATPAAGASAALHGLLTALGVPDRDIPASRDHRRAAYRAATAGLRIGLLIDDADDPRDVRDLLPASPSALVLVTSRTWLADLAADGAEIIPLRPLADRPARAVLADRAGPGLNITDDEAAGLLADCAGLPAALAAAGEALRTRTPARTRTGAPMHETASTAPRRLGHAAATVFKATGYLPGPHQDPAALDHVLTMGIGTVEDAADTLAAANLARPLGDAGVLALHEDAREDARDLARRDTPPAGLALWLHRHADWHVAHAVAASALIHPHREPYAALGPLDEDRFAGLDAAVRWWRRHREVVHAVARACARRAQHADVWQLAEAYWAGYDLDRDHGPAKEIFALGLESARFSGKRLVQARMHLQLGDVCHALGDREDAAAHHRAAFDIGKRESDQPTMASALSRVARDARAAGDHDRAIELYRAGARACHSLGDRRGTGIALRHIAEVLIIQGSDDDALPELTDAAAIMAEVGDPVQHARAVLPLAALHARRGDRDRAGTLLRTERDSLARLPFARIRDQVRAALAGLDRSPGDPGTADADAAAPGPPAAAHDAADRPRPPGPDAGIPGAGTRGDRG